jgi:hypothetical protein
MGRRASAPEPRTPRSRGRGRPSVRNTRGVKGVSARLGQCSGMSPRELGALRTGSSDSEPVPIGVFQIALTSGETLFVDGNPELLRDRVDVVDVQVNKRVWPCELVLPLFLEIKALVPGDSPSSILDVENRMTSSSMRRHLNRRLQGSSRGPVFPMTPEAREVAYDVGSTTLMTTQRCLPILRSRTNPSFA